VAVETSLPERLRKTLAVSSKPPEGLLDASTVLRRAHTLFRFLLQGWEGLHR
jgi:hypothetical protein